jgi:hypothetical protein
VDQIEGTLPDTSYGSDTQVSGTEGTEGTAPSTQPSYQSQWDDQGFNFLDDSKEEAPGIEMQPSVNEQSAEEIFWKQYDPDADFFIPRKAVAAQYGISEQQAAGSAFDDLRTDLQNLYYKNDVYSGDSYMGDNLALPAQDSVAGNTVVEADGGGGGSIEMQVLTPGEGYDSGPSFVDSEPSGGAAPALGDNAAPLPLDDLPSATDSAFSFEMLDADLVGSSESLSSALTSALGDESSLSLGSAGIGTEMSAMGTFMQSRLIDGAVGMALMPYFNWIDDASGTPWVSRAIQGTLAMYGLLVGGDPFGVIAAPIGWGIQEYIKQRQRLLDNKDPEAERGKKFGYVREGDKWYPAIQTKKERDEGWIGSNKTQVTFQYGNEIKWRGFPTSRRAPTGSRSSTPGTRRPTTPKTRAASTTSAGSTRCGTSTTFPRRKRSTICTT